MQKRVLVTGFGPYPGTTENLSGRVARALEGRTVRSARHTYHVHGVQIDTCWFKAWPQLCEAVGRVAPHALLLMGVASRPHIDVERDAHNRAGSRLDHEGYRYQEIRRGEAIHVQPAPPSAPMVLPDAPDRPIWSGGPAVLQSTLPWARWTAPEAGPQAPTLSLDAGNYLCNFLMYRALLHLPGVPARGFIHLPKTLPPQQVQSTLEGLIAQLDEPPATHS